MSKLPHFVPTVRKIERAVGEPLEKAIQRGQGIEVLVVAQKVTRQSRRVITRFQNVGIHLMNLPTRRDVRSVNASVARLEAKVEELSEQLDEREGTR